MKQTTSLRVDPVLWKAVKIYCAEKEKNLSELVEELLQNELAKEAKE